MKSKSSQRAAFSAWFGDFSAMHGGIIGGIVGGWGGSQAAGATFIIRNFQEKRGRKLSIMEKEVDEAFKNPEYGLSCKFAYALVVGGQFAVLLGLSFFFPNRKLLTVCIIAVAVYDYIMLLHKDKYLKYGRKFAKNTRKWKVKWKWISMGVILFQFFFLFFAAFVLNPYIKNP